MQNVGQKTDFKPIGATNEKVLVYDRLLPQACVLSSIEYSALFLDNAAIKKIFSNDKIDKESQIILAVVPHIKSMAFIFTDDYVGLNESNVSKFVFSRIICHNKKSQNLMCDMAVKHLFS